MEILRKSSEDRKLTEIQLLVRFTKSMRFFIEYQKFASEIAKKLKLEVFNEGQPIVHAGQPADKIYIIIKGEVNTFVPKTAQEVQEKIIEREHLAKHEGNRKKLRKEMTFQGSNFMTGEKFKMWGGISEDKVEGKERLFRNGVFLLDYTSTLRTGFVFGDLAVLRGQRVGMTVIARKNETCLAVLEKGDFEEILRQVQSAKLEKKIGFFAQHLLSLAQRDTIIAILPFLTKRRLRFGEKLVSEGQMSPGIIVIKKGSIKLRKTIRFPHNSAESAIEPFGSSLRQFSKSKPHLLSRGLNDCTSSSEKSLNVFENVSKTKQIDICILGEGEIIGHYKAKPAFFSAYSDSHKLVVYQLTLESISSVFAKFPVVEGIFAKNLKGQSAIKEQFFHKEQFHQGLRSGLDCKQTPKGASSLLGNKLRMANEAGIPREKGSCLKGIEETQNKRRVPETRVDGEKISQMVRSNILKINHFKEIAPYNLNYMEEISQVSRSKIRRKSFHPGLLPGKTKEKPCNEPFSTLKAKKLGMRVQRPSSSSSQATLLNGLFEGKRKKLSRSILSKKEFFQTEIDNEKLHGLKAMSQPSSPKIRQIRSAIQRPMSFVTQL